MPCSNTGKAAPGAFTIDLDALLRKKFPKVPRWMVKLVGKLLHIDFYNEFFAEGHEGMELLQSALEKMDVKIETRGLENLRKDGRYTIVCNHPLGGADAVGVVSVIGELFDGKIRVPVNDFLMSIKPLSSLFIPVSKVGVQSRELADKTAAAYASEMQMCVFPAGKCSRKIDGRIQDPVWTKTFISKSIETGREVVPCHFSGRNSWRFYLLDRIGKMFKLSFPLAMILIPDEFYRARGKTFRFTVGKPIPPTTFDKTKTPAQWAAYVRDLTYDLNK